MGKKGELINVDIEAKAGIIVNCIKSMKKSNHMKIYSINRNLLFRELKKLELEIKRIEIQMVELGIKIKLIANDPELRIVLIKMIEEYQIRDIYDKYFENIDAIKYLLANTKGDRVLKIVKNTTYIGARIKDKIVCLDLSNNEIEVYYDPDKQEIIKNL